MAIKGLSDILAKYRAGEMDETTVETELQKTLATEWIPKVKFNEVSEAKKLAEANLEASTKALEDLKGKAGLSDEYKAQIEKLMEENAKARENFSAQIRQMKVDSAIDSALSGAKARNHKATRALLDEAKITVADDGSIAGLAEQIEALKAENAFLFDIDQPKGGDPAPSWGGSGQKTPSSGSTNTLADQMLAVAGLA